MQLSDNISILLKHPPERTINTIPDPIDPAHYEGLKERLNSNLDYRKARIEWRKTKPANWRLVRVKAEFFQKFCEENLPTFYRDIEIFIKNNPGISEEIMAERFCEKWKGYDKTYGVEFVKRAIIKTRSTNHV